MKNEQGYVDVGPGRIWYERRGEGPAILLLHGGPGADSYSFEPIMDLAGDGYTVVRYDQLGSTLSDKPDDLSLWTVERFCQEVEIVRSALGLGRMHLIGQSWGAFLALEYGLTFPAHLRSLTLYSGAASTRQCFDGMLELRATLPAEAQEMLSIHEAAGTTSHPDYLAAIDILMRRNFCRCDPWPQLLINGMDRFALPVYNTMWGPNEFTCTGTLMNWERRDRLGEITTPTLILCGRYDEVVPACSITMHEGIRGSELVIFEESSHHAHFEEPEPFYAVVREFLERNAGDQFPAPARGV